MMDEFIIQEINGMPTILCGIGRMFYEDGFPIHISVDILKDKGYAVSVLHIADELYKNGWKKRSIVNTLSQDFEGCEKLVSDFVDAGMSGEKRTDKPPIGREWIYSQNGYEEQREMLFRSLYGFPSIEAINNKDKREEPTRIYENALFSECMKNINTI